MKNSYNLVSKNNRAGKTFGARYLADKTNLLWFPFTSELDFAAEYFSDTKCKKDEIDPKTGVTYRQIKKAIGRALDELNPEISVIRTKEIMKQEVARGAGLVIDDCRRQREFIFLDNLAAKYGVKHVVIEVVAAPVVGAKPDVWEECLEPWGKAAWPEKRSYVTNDGTDQYLKELHAMVRWHEES